MYLAHGPLAVQLYASHISVRSISNFCADARFRSPIIPEMTPVKYGQRLNRALLYRPFHLINMASRALGGPISPGRNSRLLHSVKVAAATETQTCRQGMRGLALLVFHQPGILLLRRSPQILQPMTTFTQLRSSVADAGP